MDKIVVGADIGGTNTSIGLVTEKGRLVGEMKFSTRDFSEPEDLVETVSSEIRSKLAGIDAARLCGVGLGAPNGNFYSGMVENAPNLKWPGKVALASMFSEHLDVPTVLTNDANAAALGEMIYGKAKGMRNFVVITLGTGLGSGIVVNGEVLYGHSGFAGELGHTTAVHGGRPCTCGRIGCLEAYVSARGIRQTALESLAQFEGPSILKGLNEAQIGPKTIYNAALKGDALALDVFRQSGEILGRQLADTVAILSPEAIFVYGGIATSGEFLLEPTRLALNAYMLEIFRGTVRLEASGMPGRSAGVLGAAALAWKSFC
jgi:glucokinase